MKKLLIGLTLFSYSCGDLLLHDELINERPLEPGIYHQLSSLNQLDDHIIVRHDKFYYADKKPLGRCEDPLLIENEYLLLSKEGNMEAFPVWDQFELYNFTKIGSQTIAFKNYQPEQKPLFEYRTLSEDLHMVNSYAVDLSEVIPSDAWKTSLFQVAGLEHSEILLMTQLYLNSDKKILLCKIIDGEIKESLISETYGNSTDLNLSKPFIVGDDLYVVNRNYKNSSNQLTLLQADFEQKSIRQISDFKVDDPGISEIIPYFDSYAFLAYSGKLYVFDASAKRFIEVELKGVKASNIFVINAGGHFLVVSFTLNHETHIGVIKENELVDYGLKNENWTSQYILLDSEELVKIEPFEDTKGSLTTRFQKATPLENTLTKTLFEGVTFRRTCNWD